MTQPKGTVQEAIDFHPEHDARVLKRAMKGLSVDQQPMLDIMPKRTNKQRQEIAAVYKTMYGKDLLNEFRKELGGHFEKVLLAMMLPPDEYDASELNKAATRVVGSDDDALIEILCSRTNAEIAAINQVYKNKYGHTLESDIKTITMSHFRKLLVSLAFGHRLEHQPVEYRKALMDVKRLHDAGEGRRGTDESEFIAILASQSYPQLREVFKAYEHHFKKSISDVISSEMSGDLKRALLAIVKVVEDKCGYFAEKLYEAMKGAGTDDKALIRIVVSHSEIDLEDIKVAFQQRYKKPLALWIKEETSGMYQNILLALVKGH